jgi:hypothetical protein
MTMEAFPHSGTQLASVHPCKHASVMKKFIDRMEQPQDAAEGSSNSPPGKKRWLGGVMRKVTGGDKPPKPDAKEEEEPSGVQVDFYLVIVRIREGRADTSSSSLLLALCPPSRWTARPPRPSNDHVKIYAVHEARNSSGVVSLHASRVENEGWSWRRA